jgi:hypothetical protein
LTLPGFDYGFPFFGQFHLGGNRKIPPAEGVFDNPYLGRVPVWKLNRPAVELDIVALSPRSPGRQKSANPVRPLPVAPLFEAGTGVTWGNQPCGILMLGPGQAVAQSCPK